jgi:hypothetical protein
LKKTAWILAICAVTLLIVLPAISSVNNTTSNLVLKDRALRADGEPLPPPIPPNPKFSVVSLLVADGEPLPPPIPPNPKFSVVNPLVADGEPLPPPIPPHPSLNMMLV